MTSLYTLGIEAFLEVARSGNFIRAAQHLHLSQSTVSHRLEELEKEVGVQLIDRRRGLRTVQLTPAGERFLAIAERWDALRREIRQFRHGGSLSLAIGAVDSVNAFILPPVYRLLRQRAPQLQLELRTQQSAELYELVERRELDVAFVLHERFMPNVVLKALFREPMVLLKPRGADPPRQPIPPHDLDPQYELYINWSPLFQSWHDQWWGPRGGPLVVLDTAQLIMALMTHPEQWAVVPQSMARAFAATGQFACYALADPPPERVCYWIEHKTPRAGSEAALALLWECARQLAEPDPHWLAALPVGSPTDMVPRSP
ncbi:MAG: LysR family transcriptional regulator [Firmicutes bacterium]|nr:LysR family transcriptional regulator [Alicyclobacillaceae bacterium]MCL6496103.1 LysR family transcriptional regulator [Bacillota bacterium]